ncbi:glycosyltransferase family 2 protein [Nocardioides bruguierae]|uniref:glycosyltransferase family 2 protein n=1 Tax=Nocardioides bruguierae TaxID=2945102 RepID=UPI0020212BD7|nr:glycosyltransferase family 2 protein [Nocardioides bruguierae]MCL8026145.1 glycosyltransferase family 2 protein [Nocardioides bruguierae]
MHPTQTHPTDHAGTVAGLSATTRAHQAHSSHLELQPATTAHLAHLAAHQAASVAEASLPSRGEVGARPTVTVVVPARNEARNIGHVLERLPEGIDQVVLVDGSSRDDTVAVALAVRPDIEVVHQARRGKGNALAAGFEAATGDYIVMIDADGSMDPREIRRYIAALDAGADYAKGTRFTDGGGSDDITWVRRTGNKALNLTANGLFGTRYSDLCYGYNAFRRSCLEAFALPDGHDIEAEKRWGDGFEIETLINVRVAKAGLRIAEVGSFESERLTGESNLRTFRDGTRVLVTILRERLTRSARAPRPTAEECPVCVAEPVRSSA